MRTTTILVVEDEARLLRLVTAVLQSEGYEVLAARDAEVALPLLAVEGPDLVLLDLMLPGTLDGFAFLERVRGFSDVPVIILTARTREEDKLHGFALGADDYLTKPFSAKELLARVAAVLRRGQPQAGTARPGPLTLDGLTIDFAERRVWRDGREVALTPTEYRLLEQLARNPDRVLTHEELLRRVWGPGHQDAPALLRTYIRYLRRKLEPDPRHPRYLLGRPGIGYLLATAPPAPPPAG